MSLLAAVILGHVLSLSASLAKRLGTHEGMDASFPPAELLICKEAGNILPQWKERKMGRRRTYTRLHSLPRSQPSTLGHWGVRAGVALPLGTPPVERQG